MATIDGHLCTLLTANREKYKEHAEYSAAVFKDHGATKVVSGREPQTPWPARARSAVG